MTALIIGLFIVAALASIPIAHALVLASVAGLFILDRVPVHMAVEQMLAQTQSFPLIAIPFFMMTGALMVSGKLGQSLVNLLSMMIGRVHGGPAQVGVLSSTIFGGVSGSAVADTAALASLLLPMMVRAGHDKARAGGLIASAGVIAPIIPPSIGFVIFGVAANVSIGKLFLAAEDAPRLRAYATRTGLAGHTRNSITQLPVLERELAKARQYGMARDNEELELGVRCMAAGIYDDQSRLVAGLSISAPADRLDEAWLPKLQDSAKKISTALGYRES